MAPHDASGSEAHMRRETRVRIAAFVVIVLFVGTALITMLY
jgi:hypothetical protein